MITKRWFFVLTIVVLVLSSAVPIHPDASIAVADEQRGIVLGYAVPGACHGLSTDGTLLTTETGVYEVATGVPRFVIQGGAPTQLSPDGTILLVEELAVYDMATAELLFAKARPYPEMYAYANLPLLNYGYYQDVIFSPDKTLLAIGGDGVYEVATGARRFAIQENVLSFSPDGALLAVADGVYEVATGERRFAIQGDEAEFSPNGDL